MQFWRTLSTIIFLFLFCLAVLNGEIFVLCVSIEKYQDPTIPVLYGINSDTNQFVKFIKSEQGLNIPDKRIKQLFNEQATKQNILDGIRVFLGQTTENDTALIYINSHGGMDDGFFAGYKNKLFIPYDVFRPKLKQGKDLSNEVPDNEKEIKDKIILCRDKKKYIASCLAMNDFPSLIAEHVRANKVIIILQTCFSGACVHSFRDYSAAHSGSKQAYAVLASSFSDSPTYIIRFYGGFFGKFLVSGLRGFADLNDDGEVVLEELAMFVCFFVHHVTLTVQNPDYYIDSDLLLYPVAKTKFSHIKMVYPTDYLLKYLVKKFIKNKISH